MLKLICMIIRHDLADPVMAVKDIYYVKCRRCDKEWAGHLDMPGATASWFPHYAALYNKEVLVNRKITDAE